MYERLRRLNRDVLLAFCPERIAEGNAVEELIKLPQIVSGFEPEAVAAASQLFGLIAPELIELTPPEAELAKLFTNAWRYANFAVSNQFYMLAESRGLNSYRIHDAVTRNYPRMRSFAKAGFAAGPCLLKDTLQLAAFSQNNFFLGHAAMLINEGLPMFLVEQLRPRDLASKRVAILGMAFKAESDDQRDSLSYKLKKLLEVEALEVLCTDPYVPDSHRSSHWRPQSRRPISSLWAHPTPSMLTLISPAKRWWSILGTFSRQGSSRQRPPEGRKAIKT